MSLDTTSNMLSMIKNASMVGKDSIEVFYSKKNEAIAKVLEKHKFVKSVKVFKEKNSTHKGLHIDLEYVGPQDPKIRDIKIISKPGRRLYMKRTEIKSIDLEHGILVLSTSKGIISGVEAKVKKLGGEIICEVY